MTLLSGSTLGYGMARTRARVLLVQVLLYLLESGIFREPDVPEGMFPDAPLQSPLHVLEAFGFWFGCFTFARKSACLYPGMVQRLLNTFKCIRLVGPI